MPRKSTITEEQRLRYAEKERERRKNWSEDRKRLEAERKKKDYQKHKESWKASKKVSQEVTKQVILQYKEDHPCCVCGEKDPIVLDMHHLDPEQKEHSISTLVMQGRLPALKKELEKCVVLCSNCHRRVHAGVLTLC